MSHERFYSATDKLVNAFLMGTIEHSDACSCAVGTLCNGYGEWASLHNLTGRMKDVIYPKGYNRHETFLIEKHFEQRPQTLLQSIEYDPELNKLNDPDGFKGLCNVFDYLVSIEDWKEEEQQINLLELCLQ